MLKSDTNWTIGDGLASSDMTLGGCIWHRDMARARTPVTRDMAALVHRFWDVAVAFADTDT